VVTGVLLAGCSADVAHPSASDPASSHRTAVTSTTTSTTSTTTTTTTTIPVFTSSVSTVTAAQLGATWHAGCPVDPSQLRQLQLAYWGFDNAPHLGTMIVNASVVTGVTQVFSTLFAAHFPLNKMVVQSTYGEDDDAAAADDDTSGFNCRAAVATGPTHWSMHAYGEAIDVNDLQNPYVSGSTIIPPAGSAYLDRTNVRPGMAVSGGTLVDAFAAIGWQWGGLWSGTPDYQHFSINGT
jgi:hypothetical protein